MAIRENTEKINELINKINSLPVAGSSGEGSSGVSPTITVEEADGGHNIIITDVNGTQSFFVADGKDGADGNTGDDGVGIASIVQTTTSNANDGTNIITATLTNGQTSTFNIKNGSRGSTGETGQTGAKGDDGVSVTSITQTTTSSEDDGVNIITVSLSNGNTSTFTIKNGSKGETGDLGAEGPVGSSATINGVNALILNAGTGITQSQNGSTLTISGNLTEMLASGVMILSEHQYGDTLPSTGVPGQIFFKRVT